MKDKTMSNEQLELGFPQNTLRITVRRKRTSRAKWWFEQMRNAVDAAIDWQLNASGQLSRRPEQIQLIPARRIFPS